MKQTFIYTLAFGFLLTIPSFALAQVQMEFRPHCTDFSNAQSTPFGEVPAVGFMYELEDNTCTQFSSKDPQTLQILEIENNDSIDVDIVIKNPAEAEIAAVNTIINFDPQVFAVSEVDIDSDFFGEITPGGNAVDSELGTVTLIANTANETVRSDSIIRVATMRITIIGTSGNSTIQFGSVQNGSTGVYSSLDVNAENMIQDQPAALYFGIGGISDNSLNDSLMTTTSDQAQNISSSSLSSTSSSVTAQKNIGEQCVSNEECASGRCNNQVCAMATISVENGGSCIVDFQCSSFFCNNGICSDPLPTSTSTNTDDSTLPPVTTFETSSVSSIPTDVQSTTPESTLASNNVAFSLLQVQNVRLTSEDTNAYIAWDKLQSSQVQGYTIYYGTVRTQYIQRKTVPASETSVAIRNLPKGVQYFFAIKAINSAGDETAFSPEVSVVIGDASSSTSPLAASLVPGSTAITNSDETNLSDTGSLSMVAIIVLSLIGIISVLLFHNKQTPALTEL